MKSDRSANSLNILWSACLISLLVATANSLGAPQKTTAPTVETNAAPDAKEALPKAEFDERAGKDPFFPNRVLVPVVKAATPKSTDASQLLQLKGFSGAVNRRLAIINNQTFEVGEEREVTTPGGKIKIRCVEIRADSVVVELPNQAGRKELQLRSGA